MSPLPFVRPHLHALVPYRSARDLASADDSVDFLDANENAFGSVLPDIAGVALHRYPDADARALREAYAAWLGLPVEYVLATGGSNEAIDLCARLTAGPGDTVLVMAPSFPLFRTMATMNGAVVRDIPLDAGYTLRAEAVTALVTPEAKCCFLCSPNNPTGTSIDRDTVRAICDRFPGLVAVDEAYVEFSRRGSVADLVRVCPNLAVLRTLSKAWGLAALRIGYAVADPAIIAWFQRLRKPYPLSGVAIAAGAAAIAVSARMQANAARIMAERDRLFAALTALGLAPIPSDANFLLVPVANATELYRHLRAAAGIVVRDMGHVIPNSVRITIGTPEQNDRVINEVKQWLGK